MGDPFSPTIAPTYTLADRMLAGHEKTFTVSFLGKRYPLWKLVEHLVHITDENDNDVRFRYNYEQCLLYLEKCRLKEGGRRVRTNTLKARQIGITTVEAAEQTITALYTPNTRCAIVADLQEHASGIFEKVQYIYDHLDLENPHRKLIESEPKQYGRLSYKPSLAYNQHQKKLVTSAGNSLIEVVCVSDSAGRSKHYTRIHCSEVAFWGGMEKALLSLFQTVSSSNPNSVITLETTANGFNEYKIRWDKDYAGATPYKAVFFPWFKHIKYTAKIPDGYDLMKSMDDWEIEKMRKHDLSLEQMMYFHERYVETGRNKDSILQEYPFDPVDAFVATGNSVFNKDLIEMRKRAIAASMQTNPPIRGIFTCKHIANEDLSVIEVPEDSIKWNDTHDGAIMIFDPPQRGHPYVLTCDPFMGGSDDVAMQVVDNHTGRQVARFKSNELSNERCAWQLYCLGRHYNWALISSETNVGQIVMDLIVKAKYPNIYVTQAKSYENMREVIKTQFGHRTTSATRQFMIDSFVTAFEENPEIVSDYDTICEMESFQLVERFDKDGALTYSKQQAAGRSHDDLVMAFAAFYLVRNQQTSLLGKDAVGGKPIGQSFGEIEAAYYKKKERDNTRVIGKGVYGFQW